MGVFLWRITVQGIQKIVQLPAGGHAMRTDIFEVKLLAEELFNQECFPDTPSAIDYDQFRPVGMEASFQLLVFLVATYKFIHISLVFVQIY